MSNITTNFTIQEFVSRSTYAQWGVNSSWFLCRPQVESMQWLRTKLGVQFVVNDWNQKTPGSNFWRGLRTPDAPSFKPWSQHAYKMNATDFDSPNMSVAEIYKWLLDNQEEVVAKTSFRAIEDIKMAPTWIHLDSRWIPNAKELLIVKP